MFKVQSSKLKKEFNVQTQCLKDKKIIGVIRGEICGKGITSGTLIRKPLLDSENHYIPRLNPLRYEKVT